jgi:hypothetical protein
MFNVAKVEADLSDLEPKIDEMKRRISDLEARLQDLYEQKRQLLTRRNACVSPLCRVPFEIVRLIFEHLAFTSAYRLPHDVSTLERAGS